MNDAYAADVGDFGKFGLLRALCSPHDFPGPTLRLGVVWYRTDEEVAIGHRKDLSHLRPDRRDEFRLCDPDLYDALLRLIETGKGSVRDIEACKILGTTTRYFRTPLSYVAARNGEERLQARKHWFEAALRATRRCDLVFLDPDTGLAPKSVAIHHERAPKYAYDHELAPFIRRGQSLVVYHHLGRFSPAKEQVRRLLKRTASLAPNVPAPHAVQFHRGSPRVFLIVPTRRHSSILSKRLQGLLKRAWRTHFTALW